MTHMPPLPKSLSLLLACALVSAAVPFQIASAQDGADERTLMAIFAHPDDEGLVGAMLNKYAEEGVEVVLVTATDGRLGATDFAGIPPGDELAAVRREELRCAASTLGVDQLIHLDYYDQFNSAEGFDGFIPQLQGLIRDLSDLIHEHEPDVIVTFGPDGVTTHMDHRLVGSSVIQVVVSQEWEKRPDVYFFALPASKLSDEDALLRGAQDEYLTMRVPFSDENRATAVRAMQCHESQIPPEAAEQMMDQLAGEENTTYLRPLVLPTPQSHDLFD